MDDSRYYSLRREGFNSIKNVSYWKINNRVHLAADGDGLVTPFLAAHISLGEDFFDEIPDSSKYEKYSRISRDAFKRCWNENFDSLQKAILNGGEYYIARDADGHGFTFHAFLREPSRHYSISCRQEEECATYDISTENTIIYRRGIAHHSRAIPGGVFIRAFKLALEFFYDGSAMPVNQGKLWEVLDALGGSAVPDQPVTINDDYYYQRARELMLRRKEEIKLRLLELDDSPSRRKELRAEMRGIDFCVSILDKNH